MKIITSPNLHGLIHEKYSRSQNLHGLNFTASKFTRSQRHGEKQNTRNRNTRRRVRTPTV